jgi:hypothetical protein
MSRSERGEEVWAEDNSARGDAREMRLVIRQGQGKMEADKERRRKRRRGTASRYRKT